VIDDYDYGYGYGQQQQQQLQQAPVEQPRAACSGHGAAAVTDDGRVPPRSAQ